MEQNLLSNNEIDHIWKPNVGYTNAKLGTIQQQNRGIMVRREPEPQEFDFSSAVEGKKHVLHSLLFLVFIPGLTRRPPSHGV